MLGLDVACAVVSRQTYRRVPRSALARSAVVSAGEPYPGVRPVAVKASCAADCPARRPFQLEPGCEDRVAEISSAPFHLPV